MLIRDECPAGRPLAPGGCPRRRWLASRRVAGGRRAAAAVVHRRLLDRAGSPRRARPAGLPHHRGRAGPAVRRPLRGRLPPGPGPWPSGRGADRGPGRPRHPAHRVRADRDHRPYRAVPPVQGHRHPGLREHRPGRDPGPGRRPRRYRCPLRPPGDPAAGAGPPGGSGRAAAPRRPLRRGGRLRGGAAPALGQLGGRRGDPRRGHRPLHRPGEAALHRLRGPLVLGEGAVDHPAAAAGPAGRRRPRPRQRPVPADRALRRRRVRHPARRGPRRRDRGRDPGRAGPRRPGRADPARLR